MQSFPSLARRRPQIHQCYPFCSMTSGIPFGTHILGLSTYQKLETISKKTRLMLPTNILSAPPHNDSMRVLGHHQLTLWIRAILKLWSMRTQRASAFSFEFVEILKFDFREIRACQSPCVHAHRMMTSSSTTEGIPPSLSLCYLKCIPPFVLQYRF